MSRVGTPADNPVIEAFNGWMKNARYLEFNLRSTDGLPATPNRYVSFFNAVRPASKLYYKSLVQFKIEQGFVSLLFSFSALLYRFTQTPFLYLSD